jgi:amino acid transporter
MYVVGHSVLESSGSEAPLIYIVGAIIFLPIILSYAERAAYAPRSGSPYEMARASGSVSAFATGWLIMGGYVCVGGLLTYVVVMRLSVGLKLFFNVKPEFYWLVVAVIGLSYINAIIAFRGGWRRRTILAWAAFLTLVGVLAWSYFHPPPAGAEALAQKRDFRHWLSEVALLTTGLWFIDLVLQQREQLKKPNRTVLRTFLIVWITSNLVSSVAAFIVLRYPDLRVQAWADELSLAQDRLELLILLSGIVLCWMGLSRILASSVKLTDAMTDDGFLPQWLEGVRDKLRGPFLSLTVFSIGIALVAIKGPVLLVAGAGALTFFWTTVVVMTPHARRSGKNLPEIRKPKLPAHPLFPGLAVGTAFFFSFLLPRSSLLAVLGWLVLGTIYFIAYARRGSVAAQRRDFMAGVQGAEPSEDVHRVLVNIGEDSTALSLIKAGAALTRARKGELLILRVTHLDENVPRHEIRDIAEWERLRLQRLVQRAGELGVSVQLLTRVAPSTASGILSTAREHDAGLILLDYPDRSAERDEEAFVERVLEATSRPVGILRGTVPESVTKVLVADTGGPNVSAALETGQALVGPDDGNVEFLRVVRPSASAASSRQPSDDASEEVELPPGVEEKVIKATKRKETIMAESEEFDILVIGASVDPLLNQAILSGLPAEIAEARSRLTMVVKDAEAHRQFWTHRVWGMVSTLSNSGLRSLFR